MRELSKTDPNKARELYNEAMEDIFHVLAYLEKKIAKLKAGAAKKPTKTPARKAPGKPLRRSAKKPARKSEKKSEKKSTKRKSRSK
jgi:RNA processing factor Prp31